MDPRHPLQVAYLIATTRQYCIRIPATNSSQYFGAFFHIQFSNFLIHDIHSTTPGQR